FLKSGDDVSALPHLRTALELAPDNFQQLILTARVLAANENPQARNGSEAVALAIRAGKIAGDTQLVVLDTLAMAYAEVGRFDEAMQAERQAIQLAQAAGVNEDAAAMQQRLELYQSRQPWRESFAK
ncbi:MAG: hypothetical protein JF609_00140, partial [Verrucomicrobia bacterium]|nr:hypothetical protein [Verrucomicrobiota bacterium]